MIDMADEAQASKKRLSEKDELIKKLQKQITNME